MAETFPLQSVLDHRQRLEEQRLMAVALEELRHEQARTMLELAVQRRDVILVGIDSIKNAVAIDGAAIMTVQRQLERALTAIALAEANVQQAATAVEVVRATALTASQDRLIVERLRDNFHGAVRQHSDHIEAERLGELGLNRWHANTTQDNE